MFGEIELVKSEIVNFPVKTHEQEISELKTIQNQTSAVIEKTVVKKEIRFARLKKSLRKRSASIL